MLGFLLLRVVYFSIEIRIVRAHTNSRDVANLYTLATASFPEYFEARMDDVRVP